MVTDGSMPINAPASYRYTTDTMSPNGEYDFSSLAERSAKYGEGKAWSTGSPQHVFRHELGHSMSYGHNENLYTAMSKGQQECLLPESVSGIVASEVSLQALRNRLELVAEVYAGLMDGKSYSRAIMELYREYGGVWK